MIEYLLQYCIGNNKRNMRYIEKVAINWAENEIDTLDKARFYVKRMDVYLPFLRAMGIQNRYPSQDDARIFDEWADKYGMSPEMILEACQRGKNKSNPVPYVDGILKDWYQKGIHDLAAVRADDKMHEQQPASSRVNPSPSARTGRGRNPFLDYTHQTNYDYDELERRLTENPVLKEN